jgi:hypothetical protein
MRLDSPGRLLEAACRRMGARKTGLATGAAALQITVMLPETLISLQVDSRGCHIAGASSLACSHSAVLAAGGLIESLMQPTLYMRRVPDKYCEHSEVVKQDACSCE